MGLVSKSITGGFFLYGSVVTPIMTYSDSRKQGDSKAAAVAKTVGTELFYMSPLGKYALLGTLAKTGIDVASQVGRVNADVTRKFEKGQFGGHYNQTEMSNKMLERGTQAINASTEKRRRTLGSEARSYHRGHFSD